MKKILLLILMFTIFVIKPDTFESSQMSRASTHLHAQRTAYLRPDSVPRYAPTDTFKIVNVGTALANVPTTEALYTKVASGINHALALKADGTVVGWGSNSFGQITIPTAATDIVDIAVGDGFSVAVKSTGSVISWGSKAPISPPLGGVIAVSSYYLHVIALRYDGTVTGWGDNFYGQTSAPTDINSAVQVCAGGGHSLALLDNGTVRAWGDNSNGNLDIPIGLSDVTAIACGYTHSLALKSDGTVVAWGADYVGESTVPDTATDISAISAGFRSSIAIKTDGSIVAWGLNNYSQSDTYNINALAVSAGVNYTSYIVAEPVIDSINPTSIPLSGEIIEITGDHIAGASIRIDNKYVKPLSVVDGVISVFVPRHAPGTATLLLTTLAGSDSYTLTYDSTLPTLTASETPTPAATFTPSLSPTFTKTYTPTRTYTYTPTKTPTPTVTTTHTTTRTFTRSRTFTKTKTPTKTRTRTPWFHTRTPFWIPTKIPTKLP